MAIKGGEREELIQKGKNPFEDKRGRIINYELPESVNLAAIITSKKGTLRANHYHPNQEQKVLVITGSYVSVYKDLLTDDSAIKSHLVKEGCLVITPPMIAHTMIFLEDCVFVNLVNGHRDSDKFIEHTIKYELVKPEEINSYIAKYSKQE